MERKKRALIVIDIQNDMCEGGVMAYEGTLKIIPMINRIKKKFDIVIYTKDWHPEDHKSFKKYPQHCVRETKGAEIHKLVEIEERDYIIHKGMMKDKETVSGYYVGKDEENEIETEMRKVIEREKIEEIYITGVGVDHGIFGTMIDSKIYGYKCKIIKEMIADTEKKKEKLREFAERFKIEIIEIEKIK